MKSTGIVRKIDDLGRFVIPMELRNKLNIKEKDSIEIFIDGSSITLKKVENTCIICGSKKNIQLYNNKPICKNCIKSIINLQKDNKSECL